jgi:predicted TIM-barrel fold metal-dependent hydrolase
MHRRDFVDLTSKLALAGIFAPRRVVASSHSRGFTVTAPTLPPPSLDAHSHSGSAAVIAFGALSGLARRSEPPSDGATLIGRMNADGIQRAFVLSTAYQMAPDAYGTRTSEASEQTRVRLENDFTAAECARYPDRLVPFMSVNPKRAYAVDEIDRCVAQKIRGLKLHLWNSLVDTRQPADLAALRRVMERAAHHQLPVVAHILVGAVKDYGPDDTERFVRELVMPFDTLKISFAHLAGAGAFGAQQQACFERLIALCGPTSSLAPRVWTDMAAILVPSTTRDEAHRLGELLPRWGLDRVLWGSDSSMNALEQTRAQWPLDARAWQRIADQRGTVFCA